MPESGDEKEKKPEGGKSRSAVRSNSRSASKGTKKSRSRSREDNREDGDYWLHTDHGDDETYNCLVRHLADEVDAKELRDVFNECGPVASTICCTNRNGTPKGYGFVNFLKLEDRDRAVRKWDGIKLHGQSIEVTVAKEKNTLYIGNLPDDLHPIRDQSHAHKTLEDICGQKIEELRLKGKFGFAEFLNFSRTIKAIRKFRGASWRGSDIQPQLAITDPDNIRRRAAADRRTRSRSRSRGKPRPRSRSRSRPARKRSRSGYKYDGDLEKKRTLYIRNVSAEVDDSYFRDKFEKFGPTIRCFIVNGRDFGFVEYESGRDAKDAFDEMHNAELRGRPIHVEYAKTLPGGRRRSRTPRRRSASRSRSGGRPPSRSRSRRRSPSRRSRSGKRSRSRSKRSRSRSRQRSRSRETKRSTKRKRSRSSNSRSRSKSSSRRSSPSRSPSAKKKRSRSRSKTVVRVPATPAPVVVQAAPAPVAMAPPRQKRIATMAYDTVNKKYVVLIPAPDDATHSAPYEIMGVATMRATN